MIYTGYQFGKKLCMYKSAVLVYKSLHGLALSYSVYQQLVSASFI